MITIKILPWYSYYPDKLLKLTQSECRISMYDDLRGGGDQNTPWVKNFGTKNVTLILFL